MLVMGHSDWDFETPHTEEGETKSSGRNMHRKFYESFSFSGGSCMTPLRAPEIDEMMSG